MSLDYQLLKGIEDILNIKATTDPPDTGAVGLLRFGRLQDDPENKGGAVITLHISLPELPNWQHEKIQEQRSQGGGTGYNPYGGFEELGGGGSALWRYRYIAKLQYYFTRSRTETRDEAFERASAIMTWLHRQIRTAQPRVLHISRVGNETLVRITPMQYQLTEGGGPPRDFIWKGILPFEGLVHVDGTA